MKTIILITQKELKQALISYYSLEQVDLSTIEVQINEDKNEDDLENEKEYQEWQDKIAADYDSNNCEDLIYNIDNLLANGMKIYAIREFSSFTKFPLVKCKYAIDYWDDTKSFFFKYGFFSEYNQI